MIKLSTGHDSTLGNYRALSAITFGPDSKQVKWLDEKIKSSKNGEREEVIADEGQVILLLARLEFE